MSYVPTKQAMLRTLEHFIADQKAHLQCLEWDIREETNQEKPDLDWYCSEYDLVKKRLEDIQKIKTIIINDL